MYVKNKLYNMNYLYFIYVYIYMSIIFFIVDRVFDNMLWSYRPKGRGRICEVYLPYKR